MTRKPSAPRVSRASQLRRAELTVARLEGERIELIQAGAPGADLVRMDQRLQDAKRRRALLRDERRNTRTYAEGRSCNRDRLALLVERSTRLTQWHHQVAEALREAEARALTAGRGSSALSGRAGDGDGNVVRLVWVDGEQVVDEDCFGAIGVPGVVSGSDRQKLVTFPPSGVKEVRRGGDGGLAETADALRRRDRAVRAFVTAAAEEAGGGWRGLVVAMACFGIVHHNDSAETWVSRVFQVRKKTGLEWINSSMVTGLEACAPVLGIR